MTRPLSKSSVDTAASFVEAQARSARIAQRRALPAIKPPTQRRKTTQPKHEQMPLSTEQIQQLRADAEKRQDTFFVRVCDRALAGNADAINACKAAVYGLG